MTGVPGHGAYGLASADGRTDGAAPPAT